MAANIVWNERKLNAILDILETSSDSSDDEYVTALFLKRKAPKKPKNLCYIDDVVHQYCDNEFKKNFRVTRETANNLIAEFQQSEFFPNSCVMDAVSAENHILSFLWFAGNKGCLRDVSSRFGIGESTLHRNCERVMDFLLQIPPRVIVFPTDEEQKVQAAHDFEQVTGFPGVLGCIDGTYIPIRTPAHKIRSTYTNRHDQTSLTLQGICNSRKEFIDVFVGCPSKIHDSRIFKLSFISESLPNVCDDRWHILGDAAYPLRTYLLTPYRDYGNLTNEQKLFNYTHSSCRVHIENAFGMLKQRFRQLIRLEFWTVDRATKLVVSCCVLHNLCIRGNDWWTDIEGNDEVVDHDYQEDGRREIELRRAGEMKRARICTILQNLAEYLNAVVRCTCIEMS